MRFLAVFFLALLIISACDDGNKKKKSPYETNAQADQDTEVTGDEDQAADPGNGSVDEKQDGDKDDGGDSGDSDDSGNSDSNDNDPVENPDNTQVNDSENNTDNRCVTNDNCDPDQFCKKDHYSCGNETFGTCEAIPELSECSQEQKNVCGCDGNDYKNECAANASGVSVNYEGICGEIKTTEVAYHYNKIDSILDGKVTVYDENSKHVFDFAKKPEEKGLIGIYLSLKVVIEKSDTPFEKEWIEIAMQVFPLTDKYPMEIDLNKTIPPTWTMQWFQLLDEETGPEVVGKFEGKLKVEEFSKAESDEPRLTMNGKGLILKK